MQVEVSDKGITLSMKPFDENDPSTMLTEEDKGPAYESTYAFIYKEFYKLSPNDETSDVNKMIKLLLEKDRNFDFSKLTFENSISHMTQDFKGKVDYIW